MTKIVDAYFTGACAQDAVFTVLDKFDGTVTMGVRFENLFKQFTSISFPRTLLNGEELAFDETDILAFMTKTLGEFRECMTQQSMVIDEINSTPSHDRYVELSGPEGPFQALNEREQALRAIYILTFKHALGFWPHEASYMGD